MKELSQRLRQTSALLVWQLNRKNKELEEASIETVRSVVKLLEERNGFFKGHSAGVADMSVAIGKEMKLAEQEIKYLELAGLLHDLGMINISESITAKKGPLDDAERRLIEKHTVNSAAMLKHIIYLKPVIPHVLYHHERYDGKGYPEKLAGDKIPLGSRILAIAEVFNALTHDRPYRKKMKTAEAAAIIKEESGSSFDPGVVKALLKIINTK